jgi:protein SCO1
MKKILLPILLLSGFLGGCNRQGALQQLAQEEHQAQPVSEGPAGHAGGHDHSHHSAGGLAMAEPSEMSIYNLNSTWHTQKGEEKSLSDLQGKIQLVALVYATCEYACPRIIADMKRIETAVTDQYGDQIGLVLVTIDPTRDTPEKLRDFAEKTHLDPNRWLLLQGQDSDILELAALLGVQYKKTSATDFSHSNVITVLNPAGKIVHQQVGLGVNPDESVLAIGRAVRQQVLQ